MTTDRFYLYFGAKPYYVLDFAELRRKALNLAMESVKLREAIRMAVSSSESLCQRTDEEEQT